MASTLVPSRRRGQTLSPQPWPPAGLVPLRIEDGCGGGPHSAHPQITCWLIMVAGGVLARSWTRAWVGWSWRREVAVGSMWFARVPIQAAKGRWRRAARAGLG